MNVKRTESRLRFYCYIALSVILWLAIYQILSVYLDKPIFLPSLPAIGAALGQICTRGDFFAILFHTISGITVGFLLAFITGCICAVLCHSYRIFHFILYPPLKIMQSVPVASFIILILLWISSKDLSIYISFMMAFPTIYISVSQGLNHPNEEHLTLCRNYSVSRVKQFFIFRIPDLFPFIVNGAKTALGFCFKSGIAAEIIGLPQNSIGEQLYKAKLYLATDELFAWTFVIVIAGVLFEKICIGMLLFLKKVLIRIFLSFPAIECSNLSSIVRSMDEPNVRQEYELVCENICKSYNHVPVLTNFSYRFQSGSATCLMGNSGIGKTTLLHILAGNQTFDSGSCTLACSDEPFVICSTSLTGYCAIDYQENVFLDELSVYDNFLAIFGRKYSASCIESHLSDLGLSDCIHQKVGHLSGGMKRRLSLLRALMYPKPVLLLDEPFSGLDAQSRELCYRKIKEFAKHRILIIVSHDEKDATALLANVISI